MTDFLPYPDAAATRQPIGYWIGEAHERITRSLRGALAVENLTQPHWRMLNHVGGNPGHWSATSLIK